MPDAPDDAWERDDPELKRLIGWWVRLPEMTQERLRPRLPRPGPNDPCPCGSGRKTKKCCG